jgi:hypothetical protein
MVIWSAIVLLLGLDACRECHSLALCLYYNNSVYAVNTTEQKKEKISVFNQIAISGEKIKPVSVPAFAVPVLRRRRESAKPQLDRRRP